MTSRKHGISNEVLKYLKAHANVEVSLDDLEQDLPFDRLKIASTISHLRKSSDITVPRRGWYVYHGPLKENDEVLLDIDSEAVVVALLADGRVLLTIDGVLYAATELEV